MSLTVTGSAANGTGSSFNGVVLTVKVLTGAAVAGSQTGATASSITANPPQISVTPNATGSWVYGGVGNEGGATDAAFTPNGSTTFSQNVSDAVNFISEGTFRSTSTTTALTPVTVGGSAPTKACQIAAAEILASGTLAEDASSPAGVNNQSGTSATTASFTPPGGSLLVAMLVVHASGGSVVPSVSDSSSLSWVNLVSDADGVASVWVAQVSLPSGTIQPRATIPVPRRSYQRVVWVWHGGAVPGTKPQSATGGLAKRRSTARAVWHGNAGLVNALPVAVPAPAWRPLASRRYPARAVWRSGYGTVGATRPVIWHSGLAHTRWAAGPPSTRWAAGPASALLENCEA